MVDEEQNIKSVRLSSDEVKILENSNQNFSDVVRDAIRKLGEKDKVIDRKKLVNKLVNNGVFAIIGLAMLSILNFGGNWLTIIILGGLGGFFCVFGFINLYLTIREVKLFGK